MVDGDLHCLGTQQHLKNILGEGYKLTISGNNSKWDEINDFITKEITNEYEIIRSGEKNRTYIINSNVDVASVFDKMENHYHELGIEEWSFNESSLEEVFIRICNEPI